MLQYTHSKVTETDTFDQSRTTLEKQCYNTTF